MNPYLYNSSLLVLICTCFIGLNLSAQNPIANEDTFEIEHLAAGEMPTLNTFEVLANDLNISGELATNLTIVEIIPATALNMEVTTIGTVAIDATNTAILYQQPVAFVGVDSFHYVIQDLNGTADQADTATVFVTIQDVSVIEAVDVAFDLVAGQSINSVNILEDATILLDVLTSFEWISTDLPNGISVIEAFDDGELLFNFTPDASFTFTTAPLELTYEICGELGNCSTGIISININDIPVANQGSLFAPICSGLSPIPDFNLFDLVSDANEIGGDMLSLSIVEEPLPEITANFFFNELTGDISFQPVATSSDDFGSFVYQVCDLQGECDISSVNITIDNIETPILNEDIFSTNLNENILIPILANDIINANHFDFDDIMFSNLIGGNVSLLVSTIEGIETYQALFMPEAGFVGTGSFTYTLNSIPCAESDFVYNGLVTVIIIDPCEESNLTALDDNFEDLLINESSFLDVLVNDNSGEVLETIGGNSTVGAAISVSEGQIVYAPNNNNYFGADTFFYRITNAACLEQGMWDTAMVSLVIDNPCTPPNADDDFELDLFINTATNIDVVGNDEGYEAPFLELLSLTSARGATLSIVAEQVNYAPNDTYFTENDTFFYRISNEACTIIDDQVWDTAKVVITIFDPCSDSTEDLCIEPGNTNGDNVIDKFDLFNIGIAFGATGNPRPEDINY
ncbi:MAG: Ig-like domain-containing protein, partial [Chitinophagales bacterium]